MIDWLMSRMQVWDVIGLLPITPMESKSKWKGRVYRAYGIRHVIVGNKV